MRSLLVICVDIFINSMVKRGQLQVILLLVFCFIGLVECQWATTGCRSHTNDVWEISFSPDGSNVIVASNDGNNCLYNTSTLAKGACKSMGSSYSAKFSPNGAYLAMSESNTVWIRNPTNTGQLAFFTPAVTSINEVHFNNETTKIIACGDKGYGIHQVPIFGQLNYDVSSFSGVALSCRFANDGKFAVGTESGQIKLFDSNYNPIWQYNAGGVKVSGLAFSPDSAYLIAGYSSSNQKAVIFKVESSTPFQNINSNDDVNGVDWSDDGSFYAFVSKFDDVMVKNGTLGNFSSTIKSFNNLNGQIMSVDISFDSQMMAVAGLNSKFCIYNGPPPTPSNNSTNNTNSTNSTNSTTTFTPFLNPIQTVIFCPAEYYQNTSNSCRFCASDMVGCRKCINGTICLSCSDQHYLDTGTNQCALCMRPLTACVLCPNSTVCQMCLQSYYLSGGTCHYCFAAIQGCLTCNSSSFCSECVANTHFLNISDFTCVPCLNTHMNCLHCTLDRCSKCQKNFFLETNGSCSRCSLSCSSCSTSASNCDSCDIGYYLTTSQCLPCVGPCSTCSSSTSCLSCQQSLYLSGTSCLFCDPGCSLCSTSSSNCHSCDSGYYLSGSTCSACTSGCLSCSNSTNCLSCGVGSFLNASSCLSCTVLDSECLLCSNTGCLQCSSGHSLNGSTCVGCLSLVPGCQVCEGSTCLFCLREFFVESGSCSPCPFPCLTCSSNSSCLACPLGYFIDGSSQCQQCPCPTCSSNSTCLSCDMGWHLSGGLCLECSSLHSHCSACSNSTTCLSCASPYFLSGLNCSLCTSGCANCNDTSCLSCEPGLYLNSGQCEACIQGCSSCFSVSNCSSCIPGYTRLKTTCRSCFSYFPGCLLCDQSTCQLCDQTRGYSLNGSVCVQCSDFVLNCKQCATNTSCSKCENSFGLNNSSACVSCQTLIPQCQLCSDSSGCQLCINGYYPSVASCSKCGRGCLICVNDTNCITCQEEFYLDSSGSCVECASVLTGCQGCSSNSTCTSCHFGYFLDTGGCSPCLASINGCLHCFNSSSCMSCESGFYLASLTCLSCSVNLTGCGFCRSGSLCDQCQMGYYLDSSNQCQFCLDSGCLTCNSSSCLQCLSGYYLVSNGSCVQCLTSFSACLFCNSTDCFRCQTGHFLNAASCSVCPDANCELCNSSLSTQCLHCNSGFFESGGLCLSCNSSVTDCISCSSTSVCTDCQPGFYLLTGGSQCLLCSSVLPFCRSCLTSSVCLACNNGLILVNSSCLLCASFIEGCALCQVSSICQSCLQGYYLNSTTKLCQRCGDMEGCLICRDSSECRLCQFDFFLQNGSCLSCSSILQGCISCSSSSTCLQCDGNYTLTSQSICTEISSAESSYTELSLVTRYVDSATLSHTLRVKGSTFSVSGIDLTQYTQITLLTAGGGVVALTIRSYEWGPNSKNIVFYTNNPFLFQGEGSSIQKMKFVNVRTLQQQEKVRMLAGTSNFVVDANISLAMNEATVKTILPTSSNNGNLLLSYNINEPQFIASTLGLYSHLYYLFGLIVTIYLFLFYFVKAVIVDREGRDKGQIIAHILMLKTPVLMVYPSYSQLINYCEGFMVADLPWLNQFFGDALSEPTDATPFPYLLFYTSLSFASTYLLALIVITILAVVLGVIAYCHEPSRAYLKNMGLFLYNFFLGGLGFAAVTCIQGALINFSFQYTAKSNFYLIGFFLFSVILIEAIWSSWNDIENIYKIRLLVKVTIVSILHINAIYLFAMVLGVEIFFIHFQHKLTTIRYKKLWITSNVLVNLALFIVVEFSTSLLSMYVASGLVLTSLVLEFIILKKEYCDSKIVSDKKIRNDIAEITADKELDIGTPNKREDTKENLYNIQIDQNVSDLDKFILQGDEIIKADNQQIINNESSQNFEVIETFSI